MRDGVESTEIPFGRVKVITSYGIIIDFSLATNESPRIWLAQCSA